MLIRLRNHGHLLRIQYPAWSVLPPNAQWICVAAKPLSGDINFGKASKWLIRKETSSLDADAPFDVCQKHCACRRIFEKSRK